MRLAFRQLLKTPGFTAIALLTLALGIGVNTSMFGIVDALLFRNAPYPQADRLVQLTRQIRTGELFYGRFSVQEVREIEPLATGFDSFMAFDRVMYTMAEPGQPAERLFAIRSTSGVTDTLRIQPLLGRHFAPEEFLPGNDNVVMLTESTWRQRFASDPNIIGRTLRLDGEIVTVIGVVPERSEYRAYWGDAALWRPLNFTADQVNFRGYRQFWLIGRLKPDASPQNVVAQLEPLALRLQKEFPSEYPDLKHTTVTLPSAAVTDVQRDMTWMLFGLSSFVLLIACANLANLQLARATASMRELAIRAALGASRLRLITQQLKESLLLALAGGTLGLMVAAWLNRLAERAIVNGGAAGFELTMDLRVLAASLAVTLLTGILFGVAPAIFASRTDVASGVKAQARGSTAGRGPQRLRQALIVGEVALALVLLGGAAILNRGFARMLERDPGWETSRVLTAVLPIPEPRYPDAEDRVVFFRKLEDRLTAIPGVEHVGLATYVPLLNYSTDRQVYLDAPEAEGSAANIVASHSMVSSDYFAAMGIRLMEGRTFAPDLRPDGPPYVVINETLARKFWPNESAVGRQLGGFHEGRPVWREVIGVVRDVEPAASTDHASTRFDVYRPLVQEPWSYINIVLRGPNPAALSDPLRRAVADVDPDLAADFIATVREYVAASQSNIVLVGRMLIGFAALGLVLAALGLYGVISHHVAQRTQEFGIRLALGAQPRDLLRQVLVRGMALTAVGLVIGLAGALGLGRYLATLLPRLASADPLGLGGVAAMLFFVTLLACWLPARRATKVDPLVALRAE